MPDAPVFDGRAVPPRTLFDGQRTRVIVVDASTFRQEVVYETDRILLEAPNWDPDGNALILNGEFALWRLDLPDGRLEEIPLVGVPAINNDHVLDTDGRNIFLSGLDAQVWRAPLSGGSGQLVSNPEERPGLLHYLHGVHPSGRVLAFIGVQYLADGTFAPGEVFTMSAEGGSYRQLTNGPGAADGSEFSPSGTHIYFNTEMFDGHAQIARIRPDGSGAEQLTFDGRVNWFPHLSPDGTLATYLSFRPGTEGHPENVWVEIRVVRTSDWTSPLFVAEAFGGQGSLNVNSWSGDGTHFAYVAYPIVDE